MTTLLRVSSPPTADVVLPLSESGLLRLGRDPSCELRINHAEVELQAAVLEMKRGECWLQNKNPYPIYVGQIELAPECWMHWPLSATVKLTRKTSLSLAPAKVATTASPERTGSAMDIQRRNRRRYIVIGVCGVLGAVMLMNGPEKRSAGSEQQLKTLIAAFSQEANSDGGVRDSLVNSLWEIEQKEARFRPERDFVKGLFDDYTEVYRQLQQCNRSIVDKDAKEAAGQLERFVIQRIDELATRRSF